MTDGPELNSASDGSNGVTVVGDTEETLASASFNPDAFSGADDGWCGVTISLAPPAPTAPDKEWAGAQPGGLNNPRFDPTDIVSY